MLETTHRRIARRIAEELNLNEHESGLLEVGSINPDSLVNFPHHRGKDVDIVGNILKARLLSLKGDNECFHQLGIALHYIEDKWTSSPRLGDEYTQWEMLIDKCKVFDDEKLIAEIKGLNMPAKDTEFYINLLIDLNRDNVPVVKTFRGLSFRLQNVLYPYKISSYGNISKALEKKHSRSIDFAFLKRLTGWSNPVLDLNFAYRICLKVARSILKTQTLEGEIETITEILNPSKK